MTFLPNRILKNNFCLSDFHDEILATGGADGEVKYWEDIRDIRDIRDKEPLKTVKLINDNCDSGEITRQILNIY